MSTTATQHAPCGLCERDIPEGEIVTLWNDKSYCSACLKKYSPELFEYATNRETLKETFPPLSQMKRFRLMFWMGHQSDLLLMSSLIGFFTCLMLLITGILASGSSGMTLRALLVWPALVTLNGILCLWYIARRRRLLTLSSVVCSNGKLHAFNAWGDLLRVTPLSQVVAAYSNFSGWDVISCLALYDSGPNDLWGRHLAYCGHTPEMRKIWTDFFKLSGVKVQY